MKSMKSIAWDDSHYYITFKFQRFEKWMNFPQFYFLSLNFLHLPAPAFPFPWFLKINKKDLSSNFLPHPAPYFFLFFPQFLWSSSFPSFCSLFFTKLKNPFHWFLSLPTAHLIPQRFHLILLTSPTPPPLQNFFSSFIFNFAHIL